MASPAAPNLYYVFYIGHVHLYILKMHPDGLSRCLIQMFNLGVVRFFISSMHPDESSEYNYVPLLFYIFNLHLHPGGLIRND